MGTAREGNARTFAVASTIGFIYLILHFFDRRRMVHLWFALQAMGASYFVLERLGIPQTLLGLHHLSTWFVAASGVWIRIVSLGVR